MMKRPYDQASYQQWRSKFPWTDEQFAIELDVLAAAVKEQSDFMHSRYVRLAELARAGRISAKIVSLCLGALIKTCSVAGCGKKALYRIGTEGRCSTHRMVTTAAVQDYNRRKALKSAAYDAERKKRDDRDLQTKSLRATSRYSKKGNS